MTTASLFKKVTTSTLLLAILGASGALVGGCAYGGVATTPDGTVILARNGLLGAARKIFVCKVVGNNLACVESSSAP